MADLLYVEYFFQLILGRYKYLSRFRAVDRSYYAYRLELVDDTPRTVEPDFELTLYGRCRALLSRYHVSSYIFEKTIALR